MTSPRPTESDGAILALLEVLAKYVYYRMNVSQPRNVTVRKLSAVTRIGAQCIGLHLQHRKKRIIYVALSNIVTGKRYTWRFILSILAHELAHVIGDNHCKTFKARHRRCMRIMREIIK